jgi:2-polyprenyl-6-hydroxyphenyl methylase/3-demethylubiquinone-9 3-methyltransferase
MRAMRPCPQDHPRVVGNAFANGDRPVSVAGRMRGYTYWVWQFRRKHAASWRRKTGADMAETISGHGHEAIAEGASVDTAEVARFAALAETWWDPKGKMAPIHKLNPARLGYIRDRLVQHFGRDAQGIRPFTALRLLDVGCGGGLLAEPMARLGADVVGIDAANTNIEVARAHAAESGLAIDYRHTTVEALAATGETFDVVLSMEVVEHVADVGAFLGACAAVLEPGGAMVLATLNRTPKAFALAIVGAEYLLRWLPRGTHDWRKFVKPSELGRHLRAHGLAIEDLTGLAYNPLNDKWTTAPRDLDVNYMAFATKPLP